MRRVLVVTVTSGLGVWEGQVAAHCPVPWVTEIYGTNKPHYCDFEQWAGSAKWSNEATPSQMNFLIVNFENLFAREYDTALGHTREWLPVPNEKLLAWEPDLVVVDESHHIGDPTTIQFKEAHRIGREAQFRVFMTGSMFHRKPPYVFGQAKFYDDGAALGSSFAQYRRRIEVKGGFGGYETLRYRNLRWMTRQLKPFVYMEKYVPPRDAVKNVLTFDLTGTNLKQYSAMATEGVITASEGRRVLADLVLTKHLRLQQICGGFVSGMWSPAKDQYTTVKVGTDKLDMCRDRLCEYLEQDIEKAIIGCRFLPELAAIARIAKALGFLPILFHGGVPKGDERTRRVALFQETSKPALFISQIAAGKESIDLSAASVMMFFSLSESYVDHDQFSKRIEKYNEDRTLMYDYLQANGTRDAVTLAALEEKRNVADFIVEDPERVEELATLENRKRAAA